MPVCRAGRQRWSSRWSRSPVPVPAGTEWVKGHWEKKAFPHKTWHPGQHDKHGKWHNGHRSHDHVYKWVYVPSHWDHVWVKGHWDCRHH
ncbi:hypothetical protein [Streptomyces sp. NPDC012825]|uniref:hypothetical protein n=1 Tax=Streptomyces sp. NPDC012825 TaxID=3364851 RepID=UPI0036A61BF0